ncbi:MAG: ABC transporter ATP-binding protein [Pseudomonadales bacterium]
MSTQQTTKVAPAEELLRVSDLATSFDADAGRVEVLDDIDLYVNHGETLGIVGESGCGKSVTALSIMGLLPKPSGRIERGSIQFAGAEISQLDAEARAKLRGNRISMIFQEPMTALNPVHRIGKQLLEAYQLHRPELSQGEKLSSAVDMLAEVGIPDPERRLTEYPHELSGGMRQRVMIAMALACEPELLIADEPTTALDVTIQAQILDLMKKLQKLHGMAIMFITHDLGVIAEVCDRVVVMYAGRIVESAPVRELFATPRHPYTQGLLSSIPRLTEQPKSRLRTIAGNVPGQRDMPSGCRFRDRCVFAQSRCADAIPTTDQLSDSHSVACHFWRDLAPQQSAS